MMAVITTFKDALFITGGDFTPDEAKSILPAFFPNALALMVRICDYEGCDGVTRVIPITLVGLIPLLHEQGYFFEIREALGLFPFYTNKAIFSK